MHTRQTIGEFLKNADNWLLGALGAMAVVFFVQTFGYRPAAALFPRIVSTVVAALCFYELGVNLWTFLAARSKTRPRGDAARGGAAWYWVFLSLVIYVGLIYLVGFNFATAIYLIAFPIMVGYRRWAIVLVTAIVLTVLVDVGFGRFLHVPLPAGLLGGLLGR